MKCPKCGQELKPSKNNPEYMLCFDCKKKYKISDKKEQQKEEEQRYSNIPPKHVRNKREKEMRKAYDEMLSTEGSGKRRRKASQDEILEDYEEEKISKAPIIILGIAIVIVAGLIIYMLLK